MAKKRTAIIGGGPAGATAGGLLKKYMPDMEVVILEREKFPRDHVGESLLPTVNPVLQELECWDNVEEADFPIKIGATYKWGNSEDLWDFEFIPAQMFRDEPRPAKFEGQRAITAFQVDRAKYDDILLRNAEKFGCEVREETRVVEILKEGDKVTGIKLDSGEVVTADYYLDCSGHIGTLRRGMDIPTEEPSQLKNVAFWDYWTNTEWAVSIGVGGTRVQVMSLGYGWIWFIPIAPDRTSIGLVMHADYYKKTGKKPEELYLEAIKSEPRIAELTQNAKRENSFQTTKDWSFMAERLHGENWFLVGESAGFADPILAAGLTLTHAGARHAAYVILELERGSEKGDWLKEHYTKTQRSRMSQHIQFADFWYHGNGQFTDLQEVSSKIAKDQGLEMTADEAFRWLGTGGFLNDTYTFAGVAEFNIGSMKLISQMFCGDDATWEVGKNNWFKLNLVGAEERTVAVLDEGRIFEEPCYLRDGKILPKFAVFGQLIDILKKKRNIASIRIAIGELAQKEGIPIDAQVDYMLELLEFMVLEGWVDASVRKNLPIIPYRTAEESPTLHPNRDAEMTSGRG
jgi:flavin-dependent dehydrogenase